MASTAEEERARRHTRSIWREKRSRERHAQLKATLAADKAQKTITADQEKAIDDAFARISLNAIILDYIDADPLSCAKFSVNETADVLIDLSGASANFHATVLMYERPVSIVIVPVYNLKTCPRVLILPHEGVSNVDNLVSLNICVSDTTWNEPGVAVQDRVILAMQNIQGGRLGEGTVDWVTPSHLHVSAARFKAKGGLLDIVVSVFMPDGKQALFLEEVCDKDVPAGSRCTAVWASWSFMTTVLQAQQIEDYSRTVYSWILEYAEQSKRFVLSAAAQFRLNRCGPWYKCVVANAYDTGIKVEHAGSKKRVVVESSRDADVDLSLDPLCDYDDCVRGCFQREDGSYHDYCGKTHARAAGKLPRLRKRRRDSAEDVSNVPPPTATANVKIDFADDSEEDAIDLTGVLPHPLHEVQRRLGVKTRYINLHLSSTDPECLTLAVRLTVVRRNLAALKPAKAKAAAKHPVYTDDLIAASGAFAESTVAAFKNDDMRAANAAKWTLRQSLSRSCSLADAIVQRIDARHALVSGTTSARTSIDMERACDFSLSAFDTLRVAVNVSAMVSVQGAGKTSALNAISAIPGLTVKPEQIDLFMPDLKVFLDAVPDGSVTDVQSKCMAAETAILAAKHDVSDPASKFVVERLPSCCILFGLVSYKNGHLSKEQFMELVRRVQREGYLPGSLWFINESPATCKARLEARASAETDPTLKAQRVSEAASPLSYLQDLSDAHDMLYGCNPALRNRVQIFVEALPTRVDAEEYDALVRRVHGGRITAYFASLTTSAILGQGDSHDGAAPARDAV